MGMNMKIDLNAQSEWDAQVAQVIDLTGLKCPMPILRTKKALAGMAAGAVLKVHTTDSAAIEDLALFCQQTGHQLLGQSAVLDEVGAADHWIARKP